MSVTDSGRWPVLMVGGAPDVGMLGDISALAAAAEESDGNPPLSEQTLVELHAAGSDADALRVFATYVPEDRSDPSTAEALAGVAVVRLAGEESVMELVVHPTYRNQGIGSALAAAVRSESDLPALKAWSHGNHEAAVELAARFGYAPVRELWRMRLTRAARALQAKPEVSLPEGVVLRHFVPGRDEAAWLRVNAAAFAHHPEQGALTAADLQVRMDEDWFDPNGFLLAVRDHPGAPDDDELLGFHWTKVHPALGGHPSIGEVYVVGVAPQAQGMGLGRALTIAGIEYLHDAGLSAVMLYVDADNEAAVGLYHKLGFTRWDTDVMYGPTGAINSL